MLPGGTYAFVKGSPEMIHTLCAPSTLPSDYFEVLKGYTRRGFRVLGAGYKPYPSHWPVHPNPALGITIDALRSHVESGLVFLGFIVLENRLKPETTPTLRQLREEAQIPLVMITGDNPVSAVCVARDCTIVEEGYRVFLGDIAHHGHGHGQGHGPAGAGTGAGAGAHASGAAGQQRTNAINGHHSISASMVEPLTPVVTAALAAEADTDGYAVVDTAPITSTTGTDTGTGGDGKHVSLSLPLAAVPVGQTQTAPLAGLGTSSSYVRWVDVDDDGSELDPDTLLPLPLQRPAQGHGAASTARSGANGLSRGPNKPYRLALTGRAYAHLLEEARSSARPPSFLPRLLTNCVVYARASPEHKASIVESLQGIGYYVGMTGDGQNDSLALRAAHVGISLSTVEASVSAPFTAAVPNIACVPRVLCEGRGALATSYNLFQFMALYSTIQFANALLIVFVGSFLSNNEYLYQDLFIVFILALTLGSTPSATKLTRKRPSANLLSPYNLSICAGFIAITFITQAIVFARVRKQDWYGTPDYPTAMEPDEDSEGTNSKIPETTTVFVMSMLQYVAVAAIFSVGHPWKKPTHTNYAFSGWLLVVTATSIGLQLAPTAAIYEAISLMVFPSPWRIELLLWSAFSFACYFAYMGGIVWLKRRGVFSWCQWRRVSKPHNAATTEWARLFGENGSSNGSGS